MTVPRCYLEAAQWGGPLAVLAPEEAHYLSRVLRAAPGQRIRLFDGQGREAEAEVVALSRGRAAEGSAAQVRILRAHSEAPPRVELTLLQALPRAARMDWILEKATELGISAVQPLVTERVLAADAAGAGRTRVERWRRVALSAARQCRTLWVPRIGAPQRFADAVRALREYDLVVFGSLAPGARPLREALESWRGREPRRVGLLIGPEGDFTETESAAAVAAGAMSVSFGPRVLRVETAALYGLSVLLYELGRNP